MVGVDGRRRVDLQAIIALSGILEQAVHGVQNLVGQKEKPFPGEGTLWSAVGVSHGKAELATLTPGPLTDLARPP